MDETYVEGNTYLVADTPQVGVVNDVEDSVTEVTVSGAWSSEVRFAVARQLRACIAERPRAVIVSLAQLADQAGASASSWHTASRYAATQSPDTELILAAVPQPLLHHLRHDTGGTAVITAATLATAHTLARRTRWPRRRLVLPAADTSPARARTLAGDACLAWDLSYLLYPALLIVSELTGNAIEHAGTDLTVAISQRRRLVHLAVHDHLHILPQLIEAPPYSPGHLIEQRGAGLRLVRGVATAWGAMPCRNGKVVWATLAADRE